MSSKAFAFYGFAAILLLAALFVTDAWLGDGSFLRIMIGIFFTALAWKASRPGGVKLSRDDDLLLTTVLCVGLWVTTIEAIAR